MSEQSDNQTADSQHVDPAEYDPPEKYRSWHLTPVQDIELTPVNWLIRGVLELPSLAVLWGDPGSYKTFLAIDFMCSVAFGLPWNDRNVTQGQCVYICGEGAPTVKLRFQAWAVHHHVSELKNIYVTPEMDLFDLEFCKHAVRMIEAQGVKPVFLVIDTLARNSTADENSIKELSILTGHASAISKHFGCCVLIVHHANKSGGFRGGSNLLGNSDTFIKAKRDGFGSAASDLGSSITLICNKQKNATEFEPITLKATTVWLGVTDDENNELCSLVLEPTCVKLPKLSEKQKAIYAIVGILFQNQRISNPQIAQITQIKESTIKQAFSEAINKMGIVESRAKSNREPYRCLTDKGKNYLECNEYAINEILTKIGY